MKEIAYEGAGFIYLTKKNTVLILQKPNKKWTFPGGHATIFEEPQETAMRESMEELGLVPEGKIIGYLEYIKPDTKGKCFSFIMKIKKEFKPKLSSEHHDFKWVSVSKLKNEAFSRSVKQVIPLLNQKLSYR